MTNDRKSQCRIDGISPPKRAAIGSHILRPSALACAFGLLTTSADAGHINPSFENPEIPKSSFKLEKAIPGWNTSAGAFELWSTGFKGVEAHDGTQFAELNANKEGTLYQDSSGIEKGAVLEFSFAHRGRNGDDTMKLTITDLGADSSGGTSDDTVLFAKEYTSGKGTWKVYDSNGEPKILALGNKVRFAYSAVKTAPSSSASPANTEGNFLDSADFGVGVVTKNASKPDGNKPAAPLRTSTNGDVHIDTPDGLAFDFQGTGEFILSQSKDRSVQVQARQETYAKTPSASVNTAVAMWVAGDKLEIYVKPKYRVEVNDKETDISSGLNLPKGGRIVVLRKNDYEIYWPDRSFGGRVVVYPNFLNIGAQKLHGKGIIEGLVGNQDGYSQNDLQLRTGETLTPPAKVEDINRLGDSWRVKPEESLFGDAVAKQPHTLVSLDPGKVAEATKIVDAAGITDPIARRNAVYDYVQTGEKSFVESAKAIEEEIKALPPEEQVVLAGDAATAKVLAETLSLAEIASGGGKWMGEWESATVKERSNMDTIIRVNSATEFTVADIGDGEYQLKGKLAAPAGDGGPLLVNLDYPNGDHLRFVWRSVDVVEGQFWPKGKKAGTTSHNKPHATVLLKRVR